MYFQIPYCAQTGLAVKETIIWLGEVLRHNWTEEKPKLLETTNKWENNFKCFFWWQNYLQVATNCRARSIKILYLFIFKFWDTLVTFKLSFFFFFNFFTFVLGDFLLTWLSCVNVDPRQDYCHILPTLLLCFLHMSKTSSWHCNWHQGRRQWKLQFCRVIWTWFWLIPVGEADNLVRSPVCSLVSGTVWPWLLDSPPSGDHSWPGRQWTPGHSWSPQSPLCPAGCQSERCSKHYQWSVSPQCVVLFMDRQVCTFPAPLWRSSVCWWWHIGLSGPQTGSRTAAPGHPEVQNGLISVSCS